MRKVLIVTGASRGIGAATARLAAGRGYAVCVNYLRNRSAADAVVGDIVKRGGAAIAVGADVTSEDDVVRLFTVVDRSLGPLNALVNNAGIVERQTPNEYVDYAASKAAVDTLRTAAISSLHLLRSNHACDHRLWRHHSREYASPLRRGR